MFWNKKSEKPAAGKNPAAVEPKKEAPRILTAEGWNRLAKGKKATK